MPGCAPRCGIEVRRGAGLAGRWKSTSTSCARPVEGALRQQERAAEEAGHRAQARPAARRRRTRAHPAPRAQAEEGTARPAGGCARMSALRQALCRQRPVHHPRRCRGLREHHRSPGVGVASARDRAAGGAAVRHHALRDQLWVCMLYERFVCCRPLHRVAAWLADMGLAISPGTLADSIKRFVPLFELAEDILAHQNEAALADETSWRVQAYRRRGARAGPGCGPR